MAQDALPSARRCVAIRAQETRRHTGAAAAMTTMFILWAGSASCTRPPQMCTADSDCRALSCVAGRCIGRGAVPSIATAHRFLYGPVDMAYLRRGDTSNEEVAIATMGSDDGPLLLLRFAIQLPPETAVLEAYLLLERATEVDDDPAPLGLRAARIVEPWDSESVSWARQPRVDDWGAPVTRVDSGSGPLVRMDVRVIVQRWRRRTSDEFGVAVVADAKSTTGISVALAPTFDSSRPGDRIDPALAEMDDSSAGTLAAAGSSGRARWSQPRPRGIALAGPRLELYVQ